MKKKTNLAWLWNYYKPYRIKFIILLILSFCVTLLMIRVPKLIGQFTKEVIEDGNQTNGLMILAAIGLIAAVTSVGKYFYLLSYQHTAQRVVYAIRHDLYKRILHFDQENFNRIRTGTLLSRMTGDMNMLVNFLAFALQEIFTNVVLVLGILVMMFTVSPFFALAFLIPIPFLSIIALSHSKKVRPVFKRIRDVYSGLNTVVQENIVGNRVVKAFMNEDYELSKLQKANKNFLDANMDAVKVWRQFIPLMDSTGLMMNTILILVGGLLYYYDRIIMSELVAMAAYLTLLNRPIRSFGWAINRVQQLMASIDKIREVMDIEPSINKSDELSESPSKHDLNLRGEITFNNISFSHGDTPVINNFNLHINSGETVALIGATGSGKSTIIDLIGRFYDVDSGEIRIDNKPIKSYDVKSLRRQISMSLQSVFLFSDTIMNNIRYGYPNANDDEILRIADIAGVDEFVSRMPGSYDTVIGENGVGLSGGQKQRISLARALIKNPAILILDDTTSSVDLETEYEIHQGLKQLALNQTTIIVAHRISSIKHADKIIVMDQGRIIEQGTHQELIQLQTYYYDVFKNQMGDFDLELQEETVTT